MKTLEELQHELEAYSTIGSTVTFGGRPIGEVVDEVFVMSPRYKHFIQRIRQVPAAREDGEEYAYQFSYYTFGSNGNRKTFGQYAPVLSQRELRDLLKRARGKGWPIFP